jgi:hypothetical protein
MAVNIHIATRIRSDPGGLLEHSGALERALTTAAGRALARAEREVLARQGSNVGITLNLPPIVAWTGERTAEVAAADRAAIEKILIGALMRAIDNAGLQQRAGAAIVSPAPSRELSEPLDPTRFDAENETYLIPSYDQTPAGAKPIPIRTRSAQQQLGQAVPMLRTSDDLQALAAVLKMLDKLPLGGQRREAIIFLVALAMQAGPANAKATDRLLQLLMGVPNKNLDDHMSAVEAVKLWTAKEVRAYEFLLYARYWFADRSKSEIGSGLALDAFRKYLHYNGGKWAIQFLRLRIADKDKLTANLAARIVADLLEGANDPAEQKYRANYAALRAMARANGWESFGALGAASATPRIFSALAALRQQAEELRHMVVLGPIGDPWETADVERLIKFRDDLGLQGLLRTGSTLFFSAENREEIEHELLSQDPVRGGDWLQEMARAFTIAVDAGARLQDCTQVLHANALALDQFLGKEAAQSADERLALFDLRHEYIETWLSLPHPFAAGRTGLADGYRARLDEVQNKFENFDQAIAQRKFRTAREQFQKYHGWWNEGDQKYPGNDKLDETFFFTMRRVLARERESLANGFALGFSANVGGAVMRYLPSGDPAPTDLHRVAGLARDTSLFGLQAALFLLYATNLSLHNTMIKSDVGSASFRASQGLRLSSMRAEMEQVWNNGDYDTFLKKTDSYEQTLKDVVKDIQHQAKIDLLLSLAITLIAALITEGAALAIRLASLSEMMALARTARAISSAGKLFELGVFTASELSLQKAIFGKDIGITEIAKEAATNLVFFGALKGVGKFTERFAQGSAVRGLLLGHLVGFPGTAAVSATLTKIETGQWPQDVGQFLVQTATTYLLIAGLHSVFDHLVSQPTLKSAAAARLENLTTANEALFRSYRERVSAGSLSPAEFEAMKNERIRLLEEARAVGQVLRQAGVILEADMSAIARMADSAVKEANDASFPLSATGGGDPIVLALPPPDSVIELTQVGDSNTYVYDPSKSRGAIDTMLARYKEKGFTIQGTGALMAVVDPMGRTRFLLSGTPLPSGRLVLPVGSGASVPAGDPLARATGLSEPQLSAVRNALAKINRDAEAKLAAEYPDHTVLATLAILVEQVSVVIPNWKIDAVRGVADALSLQRGIPRSAVRRLFLAIDPNVLPDLFEAFHAIVDSPKVAPGSDSVIADDLLPKNSAKLIEAYRTLQRMGLELPAEMDQRAVRGLLRQIDKLPGGWTSWLAAIPKADRARSLRDVSGLPDLRAKVPDNISAMLAAIKQDIPGQPGLNPLAGANGEAFVRNLEARASKFTDPRARAEYIIKVDNLRFHASMLEAGLLERDRWEATIDSVNEIRKIALVQLALALPPRPPPLLTARGDLTPAGIAFIRKRFGEQSISVGMNLRRVADLRDDELNQQFSHEWKWLEHTIREEVAAEWAESQREAAKQGTPLDPREDFTVLEGRTFNTLAGRLQEASRVSGHKVVTQVLGENSGSFIDKLVKANDPVVKPIFDLCEKLAQEARDRRAVDPPGRGRRAEDFADRWSEFLRDFRRGTNGEKKPDILEVMLSRNQLVVTDPSLAYLDPIHNFKLAVYHAIIERLINVQVGATDIRGVLRQTLAGP